MNPAHEHDEPDTMTAQDDRDSADRRQSVVDRRSGVPRPVKTERRCGMDRRRGAGRRLGDLRREAEEGRLAGELLEFVNAIDEYKKINDRPFPSWSEVFEIIHYLGYRKVAAKAEHINKACGPETYAGFVGSDPDAEAALEGEDDDSGAD